MNVDTVTLANMKTTFGAAAKVVPNFKFSRLPDLPGGTKIEKGLLALKRDCV